MLVPSTDHSSMLVPLVVSAARTHEINVLVIKYEHHKGKFVVMILGKLANSIALILIHLCPSLHVGFIYSIS